MSDYDSRGRGQVALLTPEEKSQRYQTDNYRGAVGLNWYPPIPRCDSPWPTTCSPTSWRSPSAT